MVEIIKGGLFKMTAAPSRIHKEYWIIHPNEQTLLIYSLKNDSFVPSRLFTSGDNVGSEAIRGFNLNLEDFFKDMD